MPRCLHMYDSGFQCIDEALDPTEFCEAHQKIVDFETLQDSPARKLVYRLIALVLLILFLLPFIYTVRNLYLSPPGKAQEAW
jgi:hypothetical protein